MSRIGRGMPCAANLEEYKRLVDDALYELEEMRMAYEYDGDHMSDSFMIVKKVEPMLKAFANHLNSEDYKFGTEDLDFYTITQPIPQHLMPYKPLFSRINETHTKGYEK